MQDATIILDWRYVNDGSSRWDHRWDYSLALYAIIHPRTDEILYLGKADGRTVRARWNVADKHDRMWRRIEKSAGFSSRLSRRRISNAGRHEAYPPTRLRYRKHADLCAPSLGEHMQCRFARPLFTARHHRFVSRTLAPPSQDFSRPLVKMRLESGCN